jgi:hypothetical protein
MALTLTLATIQMATLHTPRFTFSPPQGNWGPYFISL